MSSKVTVYGTKEDGKVKIINRRDYDKFVELLDDGMDVEISIHRVQDYRTHKQNKLYWKYLREISKAYGEHDEYAFHDYFKAKKLCYTVIIDSEEVLHCRSTADLTKVEFSEYIEFIIQWAAEKLGLVLATEDEMLFIKAQRKGD